MSFTEIARVLNAGSLADEDLALTPLEPNQIVQGACVTRTLSLFEADDLAVGIWQHGEGVSTDVEADEIFVVLSGRASVDISGGTRLELEPGAVGFLPAGAQTIWTVHEPLRKVYFAKR